MTGYVRYPVAELDRAEAKFNAEGVSGRSGRIIGGRSGPGGGSSGARGATGEAGPGGRRAKSRPWGTMKGRRGGPHDPAGRKRREAASSLYFGVFVLPECPASRAAPCHRGDALEDRAPDRRSPRAIP